MFGNEVDIRDFAEGTRDFVKHIAPLVASLYITKRIPLGTAKTAQKFSTTFKTAKTTRTLGGEVSKRVTAISKFIKRGKYNPLGNNKTGRFFTDAMLGGAEELLYLSIADQVGGSLFNMDPMVYNPETDDLNWEFAFGLGVGNFVGKKVIGKLMQTERGSRFMSRVGRYSVLEKGVERFIGAGSGVASMELAKAISGDSELMKLYLDPNSNLSEDERNEIKTGL